MIALIGMSGVGKSTVGKALARKLGKPYVDTDAEIERVEGMCVREIFARLGEAYFRDKESEILRGYLGKDVVLSCGGGLPIRAQNAAALHAHAVTVYLAATADTLCARVGAGETRPLLAGDVRGKLTALSNERAPIYAACGHIRIDTDGLTVAETVARAAAAIAAYERA